MPNYAFPIPLPKLTPQSAPVTVDADLSPGTITRVQLIFPTGCGGLAHVRIFRAGSQVWPANPDDDYASDGVPIAWDEDYDLTARPYGFALVAWNDDDTYRHTPIVIFSLRSAAGVVPLSQGPSLLERLRTLIGS